MAATSICDIINTYVHFVFTRLDCHFLSSFHHV